MSAPGVTHPRHATEKKELYLGISPKIQSNSHYPTPIIGKHVGIHMLWHVIEDKIDRAKW